MSKLMPALLGAALSSGGGGGSEYEPIIITAESNTTIGGYQVPELTTENIQAIYNGVVAGREVIVNDATETMHFKVNQADTVSDEIFISFVYFDVMILQYKEDGEITSTKIPKTASDITASNTQTVQQNLERIDDELGIRQVLINIDEFPETLDVDFLYRVDTEFTHSSKTYGVGLYQVVNNDLVLISSGGSSYQYHGLLCTSDNKLKLTDTTTKNNVIDLLNKYVNSLNGEILFEEYGIAENANDINKKFKIIKISNNGLSGDYYTIDLDVKQNRNPAQSTSWGVTYLDTGMVGYYRIYVPQLQWEGKSITEIRTSKSSETLTNISISGKTLYGLSDNTSILGKANSMAYTPTGAYHPATKKYVDDAIAAIPVGGSSLPIYFISTLDSFDPSNNQNYSKLEIAYPELSNAFTDAYSKGYRSLLFLIISSTNVYTSLFGISGSIQYNLQNKPTNWEILFSKLDGGLITSFETQKGMTGGTMSLELQWSGDVATVTYGNYFGSRAQLLLSNTIQTNITSSNSNVPSSKAVLDLYKTYSGYDGSKTQVLKNINGTLTWVDE